MPRFAANLSFLFNEVDFLDRFEAAASAGFKGVEYLFPYAWPPDALAERLERSSLVQVLHNLPPGDWDAGERGLACLPDRVGEFQDSVGVALAYAQALGCHQVNCLAGIAPDGVVPEAVRETLVGNLRFAAQAGVDAGVRVLLEPINWFDMPGYAINTTAQALDVMAEVASPNLWLQCDIYHAQRMEGELAATMERHLPRIAHMQLADNPGRHEPGTGEINYPFLFNHLDRLGYAGWIGCEYRPAGTTLGGLGWAEPWLAPG